MMELPDSIRSELANNRRRQNLRVACEIIDRVLGVSDETHQVNIDRVAPYQDVLLPNGHIPVGDLDAFGGGDLSRVPGFDGNVKR